MKNVFIKFIMTASLLAVIFSMSSCTADVNKVSESSMFLMDASVTITLGGINSDCNEYMNKLKELDSIFSNLYENSPKNRKYDENSRIVINDVLRKTSSLNDVYGDRVNVSCGALNSAWGISTDTPHVPDRDTLSVALKNITDTDYCNNDVSMFPQGIYPDFGAVAKGYSCDIVKEMLDEKNFNSYALLNMGSSSLIYGKKPDGTMFNVAVTNPDGGAYLGVIKTNECSISTSGAYERYFEENGKIYSHILDISTGYPVETDLSSVTVICPFNDNNTSGISSDFLSTLIFMDGTSNLEKYLDSDSFFVVAADKNKNVYVSKGIDFTLNEESGYKLVQQ